MERRLKCGVCAAAALALVLCFGMEQKNRAMQTAGNAQTTLVIDAGHGGFDGGAVGADGTAEQDINLSIAKRVQVLANFFGVPTAMTRPDENALDYNNLDRLTLSDLDNVKQTKVSGNIAGKVVTGLKWYVACKVTADEATRLSLWDGSATVLFSDASSESIPATIKRIYQESKDSDALLILECDYMNSDLAQARQEPIEIGLGSYTGLRISKKAIHDDYVTKTTYDDNDNKHTEQVKVQGVYVLHGSEVRFKQISILYADDDYVICDPEPDSKDLVDGTTVELYDQVILEGDDLYDGKVVN